MKPQQFIQANDQEPGLGPRIKILVSQHGLAAVLSAAAAACIHLHDQAHDEFQDQLVADQWQQAVLKLARLQVWAEEVGL